MARMAWLVTIALAASSASAQAGPRAVLDSQKEFLEKNSLTDVKRRVCHGVDKLKVIPFGYSKKGAFAHLEYTDEDVIGLWKLVITDLITDKRLATVSMEDPDYALDMRAFLKAQALPVGLAIEKHRIRPQDLGKPAPFPLKLGGQSVDLRLAHHPRPRDSDTRRHEVFLSVSDLGEKRLAELNAPGDAGCCGVLGAVKSPHEPRLAVLILRAQRGFEGALVCKVEVIGAHLKAGFKPPQAEETKP